MKRFSLVMMVGLLFVTSLMGCNMMRGAGKDVSNAGKGIQRAAE